MLLLSLIHCIMQEDFNGGVLQIFLFSLLAPCLTDVLVPLATCKYSVGLFYGLVGGETGPVLRHHIVKICQRMRLKRLCVLCDLHRAF